MDLQEGDSEFCAHEPCPSCGSSDANSRYTDGHTYCFSCGAYGKPDGDYAAPRKAIRLSNLKFLDVEPIDKPIRGINPDTFSKFGYGYGELFDKDTGTSKRVHVAPIYDDNRTLVSQHLRLKGKDFPWIGKAKDGGLFGQHLWRDGGKKLVITEGELDAMSVSQVQQNKWPVVSIKRGCDGAPKDISANLKWLERFEEVVFMFDMDDQGRAAANKCALLLSPGKAKIAALPLKDANEMLQAGRGKEIIDAIWGAKEYRPEGVVTLEDIKEEALKPTEMGLPWWLPSLTEATFGRRWGEVYAFGAGTGVGKTDFLTQQVVFDVTECGEKVALFFLEQQPRETAQRVAGKGVGKQFHIPDAGWTREEFVAAYEALEHTKRLFMFDHFGTADWSIIASTIRYLNRCQGIRLFYLDHLTALAAAADDERKALEQIMAEIGALVKELDIIIHLVSHLATPDGKPHEEGGRVMIRHFKGSRAIGFWCHFMFGLERDQQADDEDERTTTTLRVLKDRYTGKATGLTIRMGYDRDTGLLFEKSPEATGGGFKDETGEDPEDDLEPSGEAHAYPPPSVPQTDDDDIPF